MTHRFRRSAGFFGSTSDRSETNAEAMKNSLLTLDATHWQYTNGVQNLELINPENWLVDQTPSPEEQLAGTQRHARLQSILGALPEQDRQCLSLRAEGLTYREIGKVLDMSLGAVALSLGRSLARFVRAEER